MASKDIKDCVPELQAAWPIVHRLFKEMFTGWDMILTCTHRTPEEQFDLFKRGRDLVEGVWVITNEKYVVTYKDGYKLISRHNEYPSRAFDVALLNKLKKTVWDTELEQWRALPELARKAGIVNGGTWPNFPDWPHFQVSHKS